MENKASLTVWIVDSNLQNNNQSNIFYFFDFHIRSSISQIYQFEDISYGEKQEDAD